MTIVSGTSDDETDALDRQTGDRETDFGFARVRAGDHGGLVGAVFDSVAERYDLMNDLMSGGLHRLWKRALIDRLDPRPGRRFLDIAGGTGDVALRILDRADQKTGGQTDSAFVTICDPNEPMLRIAGRRALDIGRVSDIARARAPAEALPFRSGIADGCTISFGLRNVTDRPKALAEMHRVLKIGGHFLCLEFSPAIAPALAPLYNAYSLHVLPWIGEIVTRDRESYQYLVESIRRFPDPENLADEMRNAGFGNVRYQSFSGGIVAIHSGWRL